MAAASDNLIDALSTQEGRAQRLRELRGERESIDGQIRRLEDQRFALTADEGDGRHAAAIALITGADADLRDLDRQIRELTGRRTVLEDAIALLRARVHDDRAADARAVAKELRPAHREAALAVGQALAALSRALDAEAAIRAQIPGTVLAPSAGFPGVGSLSSTQSPINWWLRAAVRSGLIDEADAKGLRREPRR